MEQTHPIKQVIECITVWHGTEGLVDAGAYEPEAYRVGYASVTRIEACEKPGEYCMLPYVRVWSGSTCVAEFGQHKVVGVYFAPIQDEGDCVEPGYKDFAAGFCAAIGLKSEAGLSENRSQALAVAWAGRGL